MTFYDINYSSEHGGFVAMPKGAIERRAYQSAKLAVGPAVATREFEDSLLHEKAADGGEPWMVIEATSEQVRAKLYARRMRECGEHALRVRLLEITGAPRRA